MERVMHKRVLGILAIILCLRAQAQDPQFSQYYSAPLYLNPAFAGSTGCTRFVSNYRNQWYGLNKPYNTFAFSVDHALNKLNSGIGIQFLADRIGANGVSTMDISIFYAYRVDFSKKYSLRGGIQAGLGSKHLDIFQLTFPDQFSDDGFSGDISGDYINKRTRSYYPDISAGLLFYSSHFWMGIASQHMNEPNQSFFTDGTTARLPAKFSVHSGYKILLGNQSDTPYDKRSHKSKSLTPTFLYKHQGPFNQLDLGLYYMVKPFYIGFWYRGIPVMKTVESFSNRDAVIVQAGIRFDQLNFGYSFDYTVSYLSPHARGSHEFSVGYVICKPKSYKRKERLKTLPCPDFYDEGLYN